VRGIRPLPLADEGDILFDPKTVRRIDLDIPTDNGSPSSWESIDAEAPAEECVSVQRNYYAGSASFEGVTYDNVGIRTKGGCGSWRSLAEKPSFKLSLVWDSNPNDAVCPPDRRIHGQKRLTLNNGVQDTSALHEHLAYQFYRAIGVPAPRTASIQVYVNGEYYGIYQLIETIERPFLKRWFNTSLGKGMLYEGSYWCDLLTGDNSQPRDGSCWQREFELDACDDPPSPEDDLQYEADGVTPRDGWQFLSQLIASVRAISSPQSYYPGITALADWKVFSAFWAASSIIIDWDSYAQWQNNFRLYHEPATELWYVVPWGADQTWKELPTSTGGTSTGRNGKASFGLFGADGDIARLCLQATGSFQSTTCVAAYVRELYRLLAVFESSGWDAQIVAWQARLDPLMKQSDPHREYSYTQWQTSVADLRKFAQSRPQAVRTALAAAGYPAP
jgi:spore coat protein CotH